MYEYATDEAQKWVPELLQKKYNEIFYNLCDNFRDPIVLCLVFTCID